jgi:hypothetical protein
MHEERLGSFELGDAGHVQDGGEETVGFHDTLAVVHSDVPCGGYCSQDREEGSVLVAPFL